MKTQNPQFPMTSALFLLVVLLWCIAPLFTVTYPEQTRIAFRGVRLMFDSPTQSGRGALEQFPPWLSGMVYVLTLAARRGSQVPERLTWVIAGVCMLGMLFGSIKQRKYALILSIPAALIATILWLVLKSFLDHAAAAQLFGITGITYHSGYWIILLVFCSIMVWNGMALIKREAFLRFEQRIELLLLAIMLVLSVIAIIRLHSYPVSPLLSSLFRQAFQIMFGLVAGMMFMQSVKRLLRLESDEASTLSRDIPTPPVDSLDLLFNTTFQVIRAHVGTLSQIVLLVFLPAELLLNGFFSVLGVYDKILLMVGFRGVLELVCGSVIIPAIIYALMTGLDTGQLPAPGAAVKWGLRRHNKVDGSRTPVWVITGSLLMVLFYLGTAPLLFPYDFEEFYSWLLWGAFFVPCVLLVVFLTVIFTMVPLVASVEMGHDALGRSFTLTKGQRWRILWTWIPGLAIIGVTGLLVMVLSIVWKFWLLHALLWCLFDLVLRIPIVMFLLLYLSKTHHNT